MKKRRARDGGLILCYLLYDKRLAWPKARFPHSPQFLDPKAVVIERERPLAVGDDNPAVDDGGRTGAMNFGGENDTRNAHLVTFCRHHFIQAFPNKFRLLMETALLFNHINLKAFLNVGVFRYCHGNLFNHSSIEAVKLYKSYGTKE
jgi:hypothetical protein